MHILVTRPEPDASEMRRRLEAMGHHVSVSPLLVLEPLLRDALSFDGVQALIATSRNALRVLAGSLELAEATRFPLFAVGPATARLARDLGFAVVHEGPKAAADLVPVIEAHSEPGKGTLLHLAGAERAFDLKTPLGNKGFTLREAVVYRMAAAGAFEPSVEAALRTGGIDAVVLMSPRTAAVFASLMKAAGLSGVDGRPTCLCLSNEVAKRLATLSDVNVEIARLPNQEEMLALVIVLAAQSA